MKKSLIEARIYPISAGTTDQMFLERHDGLESEQGGCKRRECNPIHGPHGRIVDSVMTLWDYSKGKGNVYL